MRILQANMTRAEMGDLAAGRPVHRFEANPSKPGTPLP